MSDAGIFSNLGLEKVSGFMGSTLPDGSYIGYVSDAKIVNKKDGNKALVLTYKVEDSYSEQDGNTAPEWRTFPAINELGEFVDAASVKNANMLKSRLLSLGIEANVLDTLKMDDLIGIPVTFTVKTSDNGQYKNIRMVKLRSTIGDSIGNIM